MYTNIYFISTGWPEVILKQVPPAFLDESVEFKAIMKAFPTHDIMLWKKDNQEIDINNPKYEMSVNKNDDSATLCIKNIKNEDEGIYTIEVRSELGDSHSSQTLIVIKGRVEHVFHNNNKNLVKFFFINTSFQVQNSSGKNSFSFTFFYFEKQ